MSYIKKLTLHNFRNHTSIALDATNLPYVITGQNGAGKTSILEAISLISPGKGLRNAKFSEITNVATNIPWAVETTINSGDDVVITTELIKDSNRRYITIDSKIVRHHQELLEVASIIWLTPQMDQIFIGAAAIRRKFLDRLVFNLVSKTHADDIIKYENAMRDRLKLIKDQIRDDAWFDTLEHNMAVSGARIAEARNKTLHLLNESSLTTNSNFPIPKLMIEGEIEEFAQDNSLNEAQDFFKEKLKASRKIDYINGRTNSGIHLSNLIVYYSCKNIRADLCSTGEQKALLLAIILAEARAKIALNNTRPILLLDEVVAHLDHQRRSELFSEINKMKIQAWLTGTDPDIFSALVNNAEFLEL